ncbi:hypothetical protein FH490_05655 [Bacillus velezensis]|uniref:hypothetical protein n=1 Tax=Bacillus velezensis TaxID=492670 RepID=UPI001121D8CD|nr:hypothetical protein [Bacillus velezensis]TNU29710.1 hypothetical protein FH490_05655 [Bacillus velezensis]
MKEEMILRKVIYFLSTAETPREVFLVWNKHKEHLKYFKLSINLDNYDKDTFPVGLGELVNAVDQDFISYFQTGKLYYMDDELLNDMLFNGSISFPIDYSVMLDTNYASYIPRFLNNQGNSEFEKESIYKTIDTLLKHKFHYDYNFYLVENYNKIIKDNGSFDASIKKHRDMYENLVFLELFKSIDNDIYINKNIIEYQISKFEAIQRVDDIIYKLYKTRDGKSSLKKFLDMHQNLTLLLIGIIKIQFSSKKNAKNKMIKLLEYVQNKVGIYYEREMVIALKYFKNPKSVGIFNKINKGGNQKKLLEKIENTAWDFMAPRVMEYFSNLNSEGRYFIPFFLSHDKNLRELLTLFEIKGVLQDIRTGQLIPFTKISSAELFKNEGVEIDLSFYSQESTNKRRLIYEKNINEGFRILQDEFSELNDIMN